MDLRQEIEATVTAWERHAHGETYLTERLHPKAKGWLVDRIETMLRKAGVSTVAMPKEQPAPVVKAKPAPAQAPEPVAPVTASNGASEGPAEKPADDEPAPTMDELKGKLKGKRGGKGK